MILCDTGPIVAAALVGDDHHRECLELFTDLHLARQALLVRGRFDPGVGMVMPTETPTLTRDPGGRPVIAVGRRDMG